MPTGGSFPDRFSGHAKLYAAARPTYPESLIAELTALSPSRQLAWDVGCGNGQASRLLARHFAHVHASDASAGQIAAAEPAERVHFSIEPAEDCSLPDGCADLVVAAQSLHWFALDRFYAEVRRVLKPGGLLAAIAYDWFYVDPVVDEIVGRTLLRPLQPHWAPNNQLIMQHYRTIPFPDDEVPLTPCAVHLAWTREQLEAYVRSWSAVQKLGGDIVQPAFAELASVWPDGEKRHVFMPIIRRAARL